MAEKEASRSSKTAGSANSVGKVGKVKVDGRQRRLIAGEKEGKKVSFRLEEVKEDRLEIEKIIRKIREEMRVEMREEIKEQVDREMVVIRGERRYYKEQ